MKRDFSETGDLFLQHAAATFEENANFLYFTSTAESLNPELLHYVLELQIQYLSFTTKLQYINKKYEELSKMLSDFKASHKDNEDKHEFEERLNKFVSEASQPIKDSVHDILVLSGNIREAINNLIIQAVKMKIMV